MRLHSIAPALVAVALAAALPASAQPADPLWAKVDAVFGTAGKDLPGGVHRFGWPRRDLHVRVGNVAVEPALALGSWGAVVKNGGGGGGVGGGGRWGTWFFSNRSPRLSSRSSRPPASRSRPSTTT